MTYLSTKRLVEVELLRIVNEELERLVELISTGNVHSFEDYKFTVGRISGLRSIIEYVDEANANIEKDL